MFKALEYKKAEYYGKKSVDLNMPDTALLIMSYNTLIDFYRIRQHYDKWMNTLLKLYECEKNIETAIDVANAYTVLKNNKKAIDFNDKNWEKYVESIKVKISKLKADLHFERKNTND